MMIMFYLLQGQWRGCRPVHVVTWTTNECVCELAFGLSVFADINFNTMTALPDTSISTQHTAVVALMSKNTSKIFSCFFLFYLIFLFWTKLWLILLMLFCPASGWFYLKFGYWPLRRGLRSTLGWHTAIMEDPQCQRRPGRSARMLAELEKI